jgi:Domain of unknown function (DUF5671)
MDQPESSRISLIEFIDAARAQGATDEVLAAMLERRGWPQKEIYRAFGERYERLTGLGVPVRRGTIGEAARDAFLYLLSFGTLGTWTCALGSLFFTLIERWFPDPVVSRPFRNANIELSGAMASLIVAFPTYLFTTRLIIRDVAANPEKLESGVRKWLTYIALLLAAGVFIGDLITFLSYFLRGELTPRFVLKVITVLAIAGGVFWYYLLSLQKPVSGEHG